VIPGASVTKWIHSAPVMSTRIDSPTPTAPSGAGGPSDRPQGKDQVVRALKTAARELLEEKGSRFSVREVAERAGVNHALIYRHFGSKEGLITETMTEGARSRLGDLHSGRSPVDIYTRDAPDSAAILARLIMDGDIHLVDTHPVMDALVEMAGSANNPGESAGSAGSAGTADRTPPEVRAAVAASLILGWSMFGSFLGATAGVDPATDTTDVVRHLVEALLADSLGPAEEKSPGTPTSTRSG